MKSRLTFLLPLALSITALPFLPLCLSSAQDASETKRDGAVSISLRDGTNVSGVTDLKFLEVETAYGKLKVPIADIQYIRIGTNSMPDLKQRIAKLITDLGDNSFQVRENASKELAALGALAAAELEAAAKSPDPEVVTRAAALLEQLGGGNDPPPSDDEVQTKIFLIRGTATFNSLAVTTEKGLVKIEKKEMLSVTMSGAEPPSVRAGLIAHWKLDEDNGAVAKDSSGKGRHGALKGGVSWTRGKLGNGLLFDGASGHVVANGIELANQSFSFAVWFKPDPSKENGILLGQGTAGNSQRLNLYYGSKFIGLSFYNDDLHIPLEQDHHWHHWVATYDSNTRTQSIYRDGILVGSRIANAHYQGGGELLMGQVSNEAPSFLKGILDDVRIYNRALTKEEIKAMAGANR